MVRVSGVVASLLAVLGVNRASDTVDWVKEVHVVFMNHLDIGFTDTSTNVIKEYFDSYFPAAYEIADDLAKENITYVYTTHAWLVSMYLDCPPNMGIDCPSDSNRQKMIDAITNENIAVHAFPFNGEMELFYEEIAGLALKFPEYLAEKYNLPFLKTSVMSQRDVPGTTVASVDLLIKSDIRAISWGVNGGSAPPDFPKIFKWQSRQDPSQYIFGLMHPLGYGGDTLSDCVYWEQFDHALCWGFRGDNKGPGDSDYVTGILSTVESEFPNAQVYPSTYDGFIEALSYNQTAIDALPTKSGEPEMGDTWIHGAQADPFKQAAHRTMARVFSANRGCQDDYVANATRFLIKCSEHTYGKDIKRALDNSDPDGPYFKWNNTVFEEYLNSNGGDNMMTDFVDTWLEQRDWCVTYTIQALGLAPPQQTCARAILAEIQQQMERLYNPMPPMLSNNSEWTVVSNVENQVFVVNGLHEQYQVGFDINTGAINYLKGSSNSQSIASSTNLIGEIIYQTLTEADFNVFIDEYSTAADQSWVQYDYNKVGLDENFPGIKHSYNVMQMESFYQSKDKTAFAAELSFGNSQELLTSQYGGFETGYLVYNFSAPRGGMTMEFTWVNKTKSRVPEVLYLTSNPIGCDKYTVDKVGEAIDVSNVMVNGSFHLHGTTGFVTCETSGSQVIQTLPADSALVTFMPNGADEFTGFPTPFTPANLTNGAAFIMLNSVWGTNYPVWYPFVDQDLNASFKFHMFF